MDGYSNLCSSSKWQEWYTKVTHQYYVRGNWCQRT